MAIRIQKADVAQRKEQGSSKAKVEGSSPSVSANECMPGIDYSRPIETPLIQMLVRKHKERLAYNAAYQRDLRTIKRLGLSCTVSQYRAEYGEKK